MPTLNELLSTTADTDDIVFDNFQFIIDENLRTISVPALGVVFGVEGDKDVNYINFSMVRFYDGTDLSEMELHVNYINAAGDMNYYRVPNIVVQNDTIMFSWLLSHDVTKYRGTTSFTLHFFKQVNGVISKSYNTTPAHGTVLEGINAETYVPEEEQYDILTHLQAELNNYTSIKKTELAMSGQTQLNAIQQKGAATLASIPEDYTTLNNKIKNMEDHFIVTDPAEVNEVTQIEMDPSAPDREVAEMSDLDNLQSQIDGLNEDIAQISEPYGSKEEKKTADITDVRAGFTTVNVGTELKIQGSSTKTKAVFKAFDVVAGKTYTFVHVNGDTVALAGTRNIVLADSTNTILEFIPYTNASSPNTEARKEITFSNSGSVTVNVDYNFSEIYLIEQVDAYTAVDEKARSVISQLDDALPKYANDNYMVFADEYVGKEYKNGVLSDAAATKTATSIVKLDKNRPMFSDNTLTGHAVFFDANKNYITTINLYAAAPIFPESFPQTAEYVAFDYPNTSLVSDRFYVDSSHTLSGNTDKIKRMGYSATKKKVGERPVINIYLSDTEHEILFKLLDAYFTKDCDVYFEHGEYIFNNIWVDMYERYEVRNYFELPIGGNCRYFFNTATIKGKADAMNAKGYSGSICLLSCLRTSGQNYELYDGNIIGEGIVYCIHDEGSSGEEYYKHLCKNCNIVYTSNGSTSQIRKPVGGGTGLHCITSYENCTFSTDNDIDISFHGSYSSDADADFVWFMSNCYVSKEIATGVLGSNQTAKVVISGCSSKKFPNEGGFGWETKMFCNEVRTE